jgi:hypothetical protein
MAKFVVTRDEQVFFRNGRTNWGAESFDPNYQNYSVGPNILSDGASIEKAGWKKYGPTIDGIACHAGVFEGDTAAAAIAAAKKSVEG